jgi:hypothetical protein
VYDIHSTCAVQRNFAQKMRKSIRAPAVELVLSHPSRRNASAAALAGPAPGRAASGLNVRKGRGKSSSAFAKCRDQRPITRTRTSANEWSSCSPTRRYPPLQEFWAGYRSTPGVAAESQRMNKARVTRRVEKSPSRTLSLLSCIQFVREVPLDAWGDKGGNGNG